MIKYQNDYKIYNIQKVKLKIQLNQFIYFNGAHCSNSIAMSLVVSSIMIVHSR